MGLASPYQGEVQAVTIAVSGDNTIITPAVGARLRIYWIGMSTSQDNASELLVSVKLGARLRYKWFMGAPGIFSHRDLLEGAKGEALIVNLSTALPLQFNYTFEEVY